MIDVQVVDARGLHVNDELLSLTDGHGVDLAFGAVGAATLVTTLKGLATGGTAVSYGQALDRRSTTQRRFMRRAATEPKTLILSPRLGVKKEHRLLGQCRCFLKR